MALTYNTVNSIEQFKQMAFIVSVNHHTIVSIRYFVGDGSLVFMQSPATAFGKVVIGPLTIMGLNTQCHGATSHSADKCSATTISNYLKTLKADNKFTSNYVA